MAASGLSGSDFTKLSKEYSELSPIVDTIDALRRTQSEMEAAAEMAGELWPWARTALGPTEQVD